MRSSVPQDLLPIQSMGDAHRNNRIQPPVYIYIMNFKKCSPLELTFVSERFLYTERFLKKTILFVLKTETFFSEILTVLVGGKGCSTLSGAPMKDVLEGQPRADGSLLEHWLLIGRNKNN